MDEQTVGYSRSGILLSNKKGWTTDRGNNTNKFHMRYTE